MLVTAGVAVGIAVSAVKKSRVYIWWDVKAFWALGGREV